MGAPCRRGSAGARWYHPQVSDRGLVYISGGLTSVPDLAGARRLYEDAARACEHVGFRAFLPHVSNDPELAPDVTPAMVYARDLEALHASALVVAFLGAASTGVGAELAIALQRGIPVVAVYPSGTPVSRFVLGLLRSHGAREVQVDRDGEVPVALLNLLSDAPTRDETLTGGMNRVADAPGD